MDTYQIQCVLHGISSQFARLAECSPEVKPGIRNNIRVYLEILSDTLHDDEWRQMFPKLAELQSQ